MLGRKALVLVGIFGLLLCQTAVIADKVEGEDEAQVEDEPTDDVKKGTGTGSVTASDKDLDVEEEIKKIEPSPDAELTYLMTHPQTGKDLIAGQLTKFLIGFYNKGEKDFVVKYCETSFRYPMDFSYYIQNFSVADFEQVVPPKQEATFGYAFIPSENFAGRPVGLVVTMRYEDADGVYENAVFNETIHIVEDESGFNPETGFLYVIFACVVVLLLLLGQQFLSKMRRKHGMTKKHVHPVEVGTTNKNQVDFEWIPSEVLKLNQSPKGSPGRGARNRQQQSRRAGDD